MRLQSLPEIAETIASRFAVDVDALHRTIRGYRDKGLFHHTEFEGRKALYDDRAFGRVLVSLVLAEHGFEGVALQGILRLIDNHNADSQPDVPERVGFGRVMVGIANGERWVFRFSSNALKAYWGGCRLVGSDDYDALRDPEMPKPIGGFAITEIDLTALIAGFLER